MLNQERHAAEGQVSAKEDELLRFRLQLTTHQQQVFHESSFTNRNLYSDIYGIESGERVRIVESYFAKLESRSLQ